MVSILFGLYVIPLNGVILTIACKPPDRMYPVTNMLFKNSFPVIVFNLWSIHLNMAGVLRPFYD